MNLEDLPPLATSSDELVAQLLEQAELPALMPALAYLTGDLSLVSPDLRPRMSASEVIVPPQGGMSTDQQARARSAAGRGHPASS